MKVLCIIFLFVLISGCRAEQNKTTFVYSSDIENFWEAFDSINTTDDSVKQAQFLSDLYIERGTKGLRKMMLARNYTASEYLYVINNYPKFWKAIRQQMNNAKSISNQLESGIEGLRSIFPDLKPAKIFFTIGALRSNGTTLDSTVLIGAELALASSNIPTAEFPESLSHLSAYFKTEPVKNIVFLTIHEYVHTQQKTTIGDNLLAQAVLEGVAEYVAEKALEMESPNPQIKFGRKHNVSIREKFEDEMFSPFLYNWIWNSAENEFGMRDLAYYVGYIICENYFNKASNKVLAIKEMIELDYNDESELIEFVEKSGYFSKPLNIYKKSFEEQRPSVLSAEIYSEYSELYDSTATFLKILFSEPMNNQRMGFDYGPLGKDKTMKIIELINYSSDSTVAIFSIQPLIQNQTNQILISHAFHSSKGVPLKPFLFEQFN